ncbi:tetratricopeptide repeat protein [Zunongwangia endophytica]|uniref:Tetratricopeptide repeat protein n=1 Tax=Zunongwangia endophytica TaxID=1808945 RepID=A0ABV8H995_9FLAO|nr:tetratricopeptide repeat protein [Zunongwangia endophytica]MDN3595166.1 tetratricopeptide repeat protein [Zunongwangia endophytica]
MYSYIRKSTIAAILLFLLVGCVENPNVTEEVYLENPNAMRSWVVGLKRQLAITTNTVNINTAIASDNYFNNYSQYSKVFDRLQIDYFDTDVNSLQVDIQELREMATYGIENVLPADISTTSEQEAYLHFSLAYANLLGGELFIGLPNSSLGTVESGENLLQNALNSFDDAIALETSDEMIKVYQLLKARAYYNLGDRDNAMSIASQLLDENILFQIDFDGKNGVSNEMQNATFDALPNRLAPLPRLDFLDPKYYSVGTPQTDQKPVAIAKVEEAYLILAEGQLAQSDLAGAKTTLSALIDVVENRPKAMVDDSRETRNGGNREDYPTDAVAVKFSNGDEFKQGYILNRQEESIPVHTVSGTNITKEDVINTASVDELLYLTYVLRQEIFISEGRRLTDLGIKFPISQIEQDNNPNVDDSYTIAQIPPFLSGETIDDFTVNENGDIIITEDLNKQIIDNKESSIVVPFF